MKTLKTFIPSVIAIVAAILVSLFLIEKWTVMLLCVVVGAGGLSISIARWSYVKQARFRSRCLTDRGGRSPGYPILDWAI